MDRLTWHLLVKKLEPREIMSSTSCKLESELNSMICRSFMFIFYSNFGYFLAWPNDDQFSLLAIHHFSLSAKSIIVGKYVIIMQSLSDLVPQVFIWFRFQMKSPNVCNGSPVVGKKYPSQTKNRKKLTS